MMKPRPRAGCIVVPGAVRAARRLRACILLKCGRHVGHTPRPMSHLRSPITRLLMVLVRRCTAAHTVPVATVILC